MSTPKQLAEKIGVEYHMEHSQRNPDSWFDKAKGHWIGFLECDHEICEDSRELIAYLDTQDTAKWVRSDWEQAARAKEPVTHD